MIEVIYDNPVTKGILPSERAQALGYDDLRRADILSIRRFVESQRQLLTGRVLDFGAGKPGTCRNPEPFRDLVTGEYNPYDVGDPHPTGDFDVILCTQVMQYVDPMETMYLFSEWLRRNHGTLVLTFGTNWPECEEGDLYRYTSSGMHRLLMRHGFVVGVMEPRACLWVAPNAFVTGYGCVAVVA